MAGYFGEKKVQCFCWESKHGRPTRMNAKHKNGCDMGFEAAYCGGWCCWTGGQGFGLRGGRNATVSY